MTKWERRLTWVWVAFRLGADLDGVQGRGCLNNAQEKRGCLNPRS